MNQIAGVDGFNIMNNLRLVIIVAIFIGIIIVLLLNRILGPRRKVKQKYMQAENPSDDSSREERNAPGVVDDFFGMEESMEKEKSKGGESTDESEVEIMGQPVVNYEKIEADLKAVRDEVTTKIEELILKVESVENVVLNKIEDVINVKIQEASNRINDSLTEALRTQRNFITSVSEKMINSLRQKATTKKKTKSKDKQVVKKKPVAKKTSAPRKKPATVEDKSISSETLDTLHIEEEPVGISFPDESGDTEEVAEVPEKTKEEELEIPSEVKKDVKVDEKEPIEAITLTGEIEEKISEGDVGESVDFDIEKLLEEEPVGMPSTEESREVVEEKVGFKKEKERDLELPDEETVAHEGIDEKEIDTITPPGDIKEKALEAAKGEDAEEKKQSTGETVDFDIQEFLDELESLPSEKDSESEK